jgi:hypothetical protein
MLTFLVGCACLKCALEGPQSLHCNRHTNGYQTSALEQRIHFPKGPLWVVTRPPGR